MTDLPLSFTTEVREALDAGRPVVALESTIITHARRSVVPERLADALLERVEGVASEADYFLFTHLDDALMTEQEIRDFCAARLAAYKVPRHVLLRDDIPKGATGKVQLAYGVLTAVGLLASA